MQRLALLLASFFSVLLISCGVSFSDDFDGTELFRGIEITGTPTPGGRLTVTVLVSQNYPVPVKVGCYWENGEELTDDELKVAFEERAHRVGETVLQPVNGGDPAEKVQARPLSFDFTMDTPGKYFLACITPHAPDNGMGIVFTVEDPDGASVSSQP